jgi:antitoxin HicB
MTSTSETSAPADLHYSMLIEWSDEDKLYIVSFPEWAAAGYISHTHGATYEEAAEAGADLLAFLIESARADGETLPPARTFAGV